MTIPDVVYDQMGIRTRNGVYWSATLLCVLMIVAVAANVARTDETLLVIVSRFGWVAAVYIRTVLNLKQLGKLEKKEEEPAESMKLAFQYTILVLAFGYLPVILFL